MSSVTVAKNRNHSKSAGYFRIGELARRTGANQRTLRFYEERGLLTPTSRFESRMRLYSDDVVERVNLIRQLQESLGCSLAEIKEMITAEETEKNTALTDNDASFTDQQSRVKQAVEVTRSQLALVSQKVVRLELLREQLEQKLIRYLEGQWTAATRSADREALPTSGR